jgi:TatD DNase family protein
MARDRNLPVVLHVVQAHGLALEVVADDGLPEAGGMVHGFGGSAEVAAEWVRLGAHVSFSTAIARGQSRRLGAACGATPAHRLLVETDAPDQAPTANGRGVNEPANLVLAVEALAALRGATVAEIGTLTAANTRRLFGLAGLY